jgi:hypothetical protein
MWLTLRHLLTIQKTNVPSMAAYPKSNQNNHSFFHYSSHIYRDWCSNDYYVKSNSRGVKKI